MLKEGQEKKIFITVDNDLTIMMFLSTIAHVVNAEALSKKIFGLSENQALNSNRLMNDRLVKDRVKAHLKHVVLSYLLIKKS